MADWSKILTTELYTALLTSIKGMIYDLAKGFDPAKVTPTNVPTDAIGWSSTNNKWQKYNGSSWVDLATTYAISISGAAGSVPWSGVTTTPTTFGGYGITMSTAKLTGRSTSGTGTPEEISIGTGLSLSSGTLSCTVTSPVTSVFGRTGAITLASADVTGALGFTPISSSGSCNYAASSGSCSGTAANASKLNNVNWNWSGQGGQPTWLWGSNDGGAMYVWNPSNFSVNYANSAGYAGSAGSANPPNGAGNVGTYCLCIAFGAPTTYGWGGAWENMNVVDGNPRLWHRYA